MTKHSVLFVCIHNSARSQMAEAFLNKLGEDAFTAESAGLEAGTLNPNVVTVMAEIGIDISKNKTQRAFDLFREERRYNAVITVCDGANAERCPVFPGLVKRLAWSFPDPSGFTGSPGEILEKTRAVRDSVKEEVTRFIHDAKEYNYWL